MEAHARCFEHLQVILDPAGRTGACNMALDEGLLGGAEKPILRIYGWAEPTVSFGYFESSISARKLARGRPIVRRWTGGGLVEHDTDLTYSLCVPRTSPFTACRGAESYRRIHSAVAGALGRGGVRAHFHDPGGSVASTRPQENACFERPVPYDLLAAGRKIAGGAQRRTRAGLLHQGSIRADFGDPGALETWRVELAAELPTALADSWELRAITEREIAQANALAAAKYATVAWTDRV